MTNSSLTPNVPHLLYMNEEFYGLKHKATNENQWRREKHSAATQNANTNDDGGVTLKDPAIVRSKGCGLSTSSGGRGRRVIRCAICKQIGHNYKSCPRSRAGRTNDQSELAADTPIDETTD